MKIDTSKIAGFEDMTPEEKVAALTGLDLPDPVDNSGEIDKLKATLSKANAEAAEWKRQFREKQTEQERNEAERAEKERARDEELEQLRRERTISKLEAQYLAAGYSPELASESAIASADGDTVTVLKIQTAFLEQTKKDLEAAALGRQSGLSVGTPPKAATKDDEIVAAAMKYAGLT